MIYIKAKISIGVFGISGVSQEGVSALVPIDNIPQAKQKFENYCREKFKNMQFEKMTFEYLEIAPQI